MVRSIKGGVGWGNFVGRCHVLQMLGRQKSVLLTEVLLENQPNLYAHFFVSARIYFEHTHFFRRRPFATIVLTNGENLPPTPGLLTLNVCQSEEDLIKSLL